MGTSMMTPSAPHSSALSMSPGVARAKVKIFDFRPSLEICLMASKSGCETAGMHLLAYDNLKRVLGVNDPTNRMYTFMTNSVFEPSVLPTWSIEQTTEADNDLRPRGVGNFSRFPAGAIHGSSMR